MIGCNGGVTSLPGAVDESLGVVVVVVESWFAARGRLFGESHDFEGQRVAIVDGGSNDFESG
jgi:hypothetical protein